MFGEELMGAEKGRYGRASLWTPRHRMRPAPGALKHAWTGHMITIGSMING